MPGFLGGGQNAQPGQPFGQQLKQGLIAAAPLFSAMAAGYSSGRGPYAYLDQGIAGMQALQKQKRDEEAAAAAAAAFGGLLNPGGLGGAMGGASGGASMRASGMGGASGPVSFDKNKPQYIADDTMAALGKEPLSMEGRVREGLKARGLPEHVANAFVVNFKDESNLNPGINEVAPLVPGSRGGFGLAQWTGPRRKALEAFAAETGRPVDDLDVQLDFLVQELQGPEARAGEVIMAAKTAPEAAAAIVNEFLRPAEVHRSRREAAYLGMDPGQPSAPVDPLADPYIQRLMQVMAMPGLTPEQRSVVELQLQSRMKMLQPPAAEMIPAGFRERDMQARAGGLVPGTPEYQAFMLGNTGESRPAAFEALHLQALAAGFAEGSPEYKEFMATRGAGLAAESRAIGEARGAATAGAPAEVQAADETLSFIDEVRNHPGLEQGTGMSSMFNVVPGTSGYDFQNRVNQLLSGGFLTAIDQLRGMGALSNAEGQTATRAISRMDTATSKEEFLAALADYERVVKQGRERALSRIPAEAAPGAPAAPASDLGLTEDDLKYLGQP